jgi:hypothetical protein
VRLHRRLSRHNNRRIHNSKHSQTTPPWELRHFDVILSASCSCSLSFLPSIVLAVACHSSHHLPFSPQPVILTTCHFLCPHFLDAAMGLLLFELARRGFRCAAGTERATALDIDCKRFEQRPGPPFMAFRPPPSAVSIAPASFLISGSS